MLQATKRWTLNPDIECAAAVQRLRQHPAASGLHPPFFLFSHDTTRHERVSYPTDINSRLEPNDLRLVVEHSEKRCNKARHFSQSHGESLVPPENHLAILNPPQKTQGELYVIQKEGSIYELPCGDLCGGDGINPDPTSPSPGPDFLLPDFTGEYVELGCVEDFEEPNRVGTQLLGVLDGGGGWFASDFT